MIDFAEQFMPRLLRASVALGVAAVLVAVCVQLLRVRAPRAERAAWLMVLLQGVILAHVFIPLPEGLFPSPTVTGGGETPSIPTRAASGSPVALRQRPREITPSNEPNASGISPNTHAAGKKTSPSWTIPKLSPLTIALGVWGAGFLIFLGIGALRYGAFVRRLRDAKTPNGA